MTDDLKTACRLLPGHTCVLVKGDAVRISDKTGIRPLLDWLEEAGEPLRGASVADKVVGKAAALLLVYGGAAALTAGVVSEPAAAVLRAAGIPFEAGQVTGRIVNREGTGLCPMEERVMDTDSPAEAYRRLKAVLSK